MRHHLTHQEGVQGWLIVPNLLVKLESLQREQRLGQLKPFISPDLHRRPQRQQPFDVNNHREKTNDRAPKYNTGPAVGVWWGMDQETGFKPSLPSLWKRKQHETDVTSIPKIVQKKSR